MSFDRRLNQILVAALGLLVLALTLALGALPMLPAAAVFWLYLCCAALLLEWLVTWRRGLPAPELPFGPPSLRGQRRTRNALFTFVVLVTFVREGAFSPELEYNFDLYQARWSTQVNTDSSSTSSASGNGQARLRGRFVDCGGLSCGSGGARCQAFRQHLRCDDARGVPTGPVAYVSGSVGFGPEPSCYTPLFKSAQERFHASLTISASSPGAITTHSLQLDADIEQSLTGLASCLTFHRLLGRQAAELTAEALNKHIRGN